MPRNLHTCGAQPRQAASPSKDRSFFGATNLARHGAISARRYGLARETAAISSVGQQPFLPRSYDGPNRSSAPLIRAANARDRKLAHLVYLVFSFLWFRSTRETR